MKAFPLDERRFLAATNAALENYLAAMREHWGFAPEITVTARRMVILKVRPEGQDKTCSLIVRPEGRQMKKPSLTARRILRSIEWVKRWRPDCHFRQHMSQAALLPWEQHLTFVAGVQAELTKLLQADPSLPRLVVWGEPLLNVGGAFNLKDFAHDAKGLFVTLDNYKTTRSPERVAKEIAAELVDHRQTCDRCGEGMPPLQSRASGLYWKKTDLLDVPPDPVEEMVRPRTSMALKKRLARGVK